MTAPVLDAPNVADALERCADPPAVRNALTRLFEAHPQAAALVEQDHLVLEGVVAVMAASRALAAAITTDPGLLDPLRDRARFATERSVDDYRAEWAMCAHHDDPGEALRRFKRRELVRIAARDLLGMADLPVVGRELAALAEVCLGGALAVAAPVVDLSVIGMGKLGGRELNYASDVDVLFVHDGDPAEADRAARRLLQVMSEPSSGGIVFRTDPDLRPEGRAGPLTRTLEAFEAYYERWGRTWEFQALIKARPVAGSDELGARFMRSVQPFVWPERLDPDAVREVRAMKARAESETRRRGLDGRELKRGPGGLRDIEFAIQLLQLVHGRHDATLRSPTTLDALARLADGGYVERADATRLDDAYRFLRTVEHRLQLWDEQQTHTLPSDRAARERLARVLGYRDRGDESAADQFDADHRARQTTVRSIHERVFFAPLLETLAGAGEYALAPAAVEERLRAFGFLDLDRTKDALEELTRGLTRRSRLMQQLLPLLLEWCSESPNPDLALLQLRRLAEGPARSEPLARTFRDMPGAAERTCRLAGSSRMLGDALRRQPDFVRVLGDDAALATAKGRDQLVEEALGTLTWRDDDDARRSGLRRFKRRELLRVGARDVLGFADVASTGEELTVLAEACLEGALGAIDPAVPFAVIAMGRLGGRDLSYASDIDVLFVYDGDGAGDFAEGERAATRLMAEIGATTSEGQAFRIDADLRPEGKQGPLARSLDGYRTYYDRWALTWEFQALIKARPVAGDVDLGRRFAEMIEPYVYRTPFPDEEVREVRRMKARVERERIPTGEDPQFHLKLGRGSLSDVEFTAQLLQLLHGGRDPAVRGTHTLGALAALGAGGYIAPDDVAALDESYRFCLRARSHRYLLTGSTRESLPTESIELKRLARMLGYLHRPQAALRDDYRRVTRRARQVVERVFYGRDRS